MSILTTRISVGDRSALQDLGSVEGDVPTTEPALLPCEFRGPALGKGFEPFGHVRALACYAAQLCDALHRLHRHRLHVFEYTQLLLHGLYRERRFCGDA